jgi:predicted nuclease of predicted toxin-antitoxin system
VNFLADECCDALFVQGLRNDGHDVRYVKELAPGADDNAVLQMALDEQRILLSEDKDFGELVVRLGLPAYGIVLLRLNPADTDQKLARLRDTLTREADRLPGSFTVIDEKKVRFRPLRLP